MRRCLDMSESSGGVVPLDRMLAGIKADVLAEHDPSGTTTLHLLQAVERHVANEEEALGQYEHLARQSGDPGVTLVMHIIRRRKAPPPAARANRSDAARRTELDPLSDIPATDRQHVYGCRWSGSGRGGARIDRRGEGRRSGIASPGLS